MGCTTRQDACRHIWYRNNQCRPIIYQLPAWFASVHIITNEIDLGFNYDSARLYCSKFVFEVYQEATGRQVGKLETFRQLLAANPRAPLVFWRVWFFGRIPWARRCVTTTSELKSPEFIPVFDSQPAAGS